MISSNIKDINSQTQTQSQTQSQSKLTQKNIQNELKEEISKESTTYFLKYCLENTKDGYICIPWKQVCIFQILSLFLIYIKSLDC